MNLLEYLVKSEGQLPETIVVPIMDWQGNEKQEIISLATREYTIEDRITPAGTIIVVNYGILGEDWIPASRVRVLSDNIEQTKTDSPQYGC
jgi:hypothetical protein